MATQQELLVAKFSAVDSTQAAFNSMNKNMQRTQKQAGALNQQFRFMRGGMGQVGHQIQDIAVQLQMGTNAMIVFGQQGSQIASLFGPQGAMIGAVLAVGAAIGVGLSGEVKKSQDAIKSLADEIESFADRTGILTQEFVEFLAAAKDIELKQQKDEFDALLKTYESAEARLGLLINSQKEYEAAMAGNDEALKQALSITGDYTKEIEKQEFEVKRLRTDLSKLRLEIRGLDQDYKKSAEVRVSAANEVIESASRELDEIVAAQKAKEDAEKASVRASLARSKNLIDVASSELDALVANEEMKASLQEQAIERERAQNDARLAIAQRTISVANAELDAIVQAERVKQEVIQKTQQSYAQSLTFMSQATSSIMGMLDEQSGAYKALFVVQQATQIAQAIMSAHTAAAQALATIPPPMNVVMSKTMLALGYAQAGAIAGQTLASFEGGGFTGTGVRSGGMDGKGGRLAMVHPNEKITDLHKNGDTPQPVTVNFSIQANDARGFDELLVQRRGMITSMVTQALNNQGKRLGR